MNSFNQSENFIKYNILYKVHHRIQFNVKVDNSVLNGIPINLCILSNIILLYSLLNYTIALQRNQERCNIFLIFFLQITITNLHNWHLYIWIYE